MKKLNWLDKCRKSTLEAIICWFFRNWRNLFPTTNRVEVSSFIESETGMLCQIE